MGVAVRGPKDSWIRFAVLEVPWSEVPKYAWLDYERFQARAEPDINTDLQLPLDWR